VRLDKKRKQIEGDIRRAFAQSMEDVAGEADENAPVDEGALHASVTWQWISDAIERLKAKVGSALRYAAIRELGGVIRPVRAKRLVWRDHEGRWHSAAVVVQVPGGRKGTLKHGKPWLRPAAEQFGDFMDRHLRGFV
jgi:hypothetical protein